MNDYMPITDKQIKEFKDITEKKGKKTAREGARGTFDI